VSRAAIDLLTAVERVARRGKAVLVVHDVSRAVGGDLSVKAYRLSDGARDAAKKGRWDTASYVSLRQSPATLMGVVLWKVE